MAEVADALVGHQLPPLEPERLREVLVAQLLRAYHGCAVRFALRSPPVAQHVPERPATGAYQRYQARERRASITSLSHEVFEASEMMVALLPHLAAALFGRYVLRMNPVLVLGGCAGAGTQTAALRAVQDEAQSKLPVLGYTVPYALGNILLTAWGPVIVLLTR